MTPKELELFLSSRLANTSSDLAMRFQSMRDAGLLTAGRGRRTDRDMSYEQAADVILGLVSSSARTAGAAAAARRAFECLQDEDDRFQRSPNLGQALTSYVKFGTLDTPLSLFLDDRLSRALVIFTRHDEGGAIRIATYTSTELDDTSFVEPADAGDIAGIGDFLSSEGAMPVGVISGGLITSIRRMLEDDQKRVANRHKSGWVGDPDSRPTAFADAEKAPTE